MLLSVALCLWASTPLMAQGRPGGGEKPPAAWWLQVVGDEGDLLVSIPMPDGAGWCLAWNHSVEGFAVHDCYRNQAGQMLLERSHLPDFAAGLDHIPGRGRQVSDGHGGYWIEALNEPVAASRYRLRVGSDKVDHRLVSHGQPTLSQLIEQQRNAENADCPLRVASMDSSVPTVISLSEMAAGRSVSVQLTDLATCNRNKSRAVERAAIMSTSP